ncbi:MAG: galactokinase [Succinivibrio sp.]|nr:galactokinase [Succinivibrio sp.]
MDTLIAATHKAFESYFKQEPRYLAYAPGRVNLIGEHTDYNGGFVLPCAIKYGTCMLASPNQSQKLRVLAQDLDSDNYAEFSLEGGLCADPKLIWSNYLRGMVNEICSHYGRQSGGLDLIISGNIPQGAGLSSSASLEVCFGALLSSYLGLPLERQKLASFGQAAEAFAGIKCGIMDQTISACGEQGQALLIDCKSLQLTQVPLPEELVVMVINSNVKHQLVGSEYNERRACCESAAQSLGVRLLRDADLDGLRALEGRIDETTYRRARHVITEDQRVLAAVAALRAGDLPRLSALMYASHCSMRDDFEITIPEIDGLVELVRAALGPREGAVRMTGGGFGGSVVALVRKGQEAVVRQAVAEEYPKLAGKAATIFETEACQGVYVRTL